MVHGKQSVTSLRTVLERDFNHERLTLTSGWLHVSFHEMRSKRYIEKMEALYFGITNRTTIIGLIGTTVNRSDYLAVGQLTAVVLAEHGSIMALSRSNLRGLVISACDVCQE